jgi:hypothetical protein
VVWLKENPHLKFRVALGITTLQKPQFIERLSSFNAEDGEGKKDKEERDIAGYHSTAKEKLWPPRRSSPSTLLLIKSMYSKALNDIFL